MLSESGYYVIRFDNRDTGKSTFYEPGKAEYSIVDMVDDSIALLDAYKIKQAHFVGMSLGGMLGQIAAVKYSERVQSLTLISSSLFAPEDPDLPGIDQKILDYHASAVNIDWSIKDVVVKYLAEGWRLLCGSAHQFDSESAYQMAEEEFDRAKNLMSMFNHALLKGGKEYYEEIEKIEQPVLIIHGTEDTVLPYKHAIYTADRLQNSDLITMMGRGHEIHKNDRKLYVKIITSFLKPHNKTII